MSDNVAHPTAPRMAARAMVCVLVAEATAAVSAPVSAATLPPKTSEKKIKCNEQPWKNVCTQYQSFTKHRLSKKD